MPAKKRKTEYKESKGPHGDLPTIKEESQDGEDRKKSEDMSHLPHSKTQTKNSEAMVVSSGQKETAARRLLLLWRTKWKFLSSKTHAVNALAALSIEHVKSIRSNDLFIV